MSTKQQDDFLLSPASYSALALISASVIAYELYVMRVFANGGWSHFGSSVVSIALLGFGVFSTVLCIRKDYFKRNLVFWINLTLVLLGPLMMGANAAAQVLPFNPIFLVADPWQKYYLTLYFLIYFIPFFWGAMFIGLFFLIGQTVFNRVYFANMSGSGFGGLVLFFGMYFFVTDKLYIVPIALWLSGATFWFWSQCQHRLLPILALSGLICVLTGIFFSQINVSPYKGVSYARNFPDSKKVYQASTPFGNLEVYSSSYFHFAPGLSDVAALYLDRMPENAYLGLYIDGDGPVGIMKDLPESQIEYFRFLPQSMPFLLKDDPSVLVMQFGGGISTNMALKLGAGGVTVAEGSPIIIKTMQESDFVTNFTGRILEKEHVNLIPYDGRIYVAHEERRFDIVDLSLIDSTGLSMPGGFSINEKYIYTKETFRNCIKALKDTGIFSVTIWNKEDPPKSVLKVMSTIAKAANEIGSDYVPHKFFMAHTFLSTFTILYKENGFTDSEIEALTAYCQKMNFEVIYYPGQPISEENIDLVFQAYHNLYFSPDKNESLPDSVDMTAGNLYKLAACRLMKGDFAYVEDNYIFNTCPLTNDQPYFSGFVKIKDIPKFINQLEAITDEWGYLLLWLTLFTSIFFGFILMLLPVIFGWRAFFSRHRGKIGTFFYFVCLGLGYMIIEISLISKYVLALGNPTISITILITGMLVFSGFGSYFSVRFMGRPGRAMIVICSLIVTILLFYANSLDSILDLAGTWSYWARALFCLALLFPLSFLLGFPFPMGMSTLSKMNKEIFFVWAWGINGSSSVVGSVLVPIIAITLSISSAILFSALLYFLALLSFFFLLIPDSR